MGAYRLGGHCDDWATDDEWDAVVRQDLVELVTRQMKVFNKACGVGVGNIAAVERAEKRQLAPRQCRRRGGRPGEEAAYLSK